MKLKILNSNKKPPVRLEMFKPPEPDLLDDVELPADEKLLFSPDLDAKIERMVEERINAAIAAMPKPEATKPQIIKEVRVEVPKKDTRDLVEKSQLDAALKKISELEKKLAETDEVARTPAFVPGGSGVIGIPPPEGNEGKTLKVSNSKAAWVTVTGGGGASLSGFTVTGDTEDLNLTIDDNLTNQKLANIVATIINQLQS